MPYLNEFDPRSYAALLAADSPRSFEEGDPFVGGNIPANQSRRTILIGLGGMGVKTLDAIKGVLKEKFQPGWEQYIGFLAVDTDLDELRNARELRPGERLCLTRPGFASMVAAGPNAWPRAWRTIVNEEQREELAHYGMGMDGTGGRRLVGRLKLHDQMPGDMGYDQKVVQILRDLVFNRLAPLGAAGSYDVYVIGSLCGGTGSGMFLDFPALIRHALNGFHANIHAMLYLPDVFDNLPTQYAQKLEANAYAALKELDYYQNVLERDDHSEAFPYHDPAHPELRLDSRQGFFQQVTLVGSHNGATRQSRQQAIQTVLEHVVKEVADYGVPPIPAAMLMHGPVMAEGGFLRRYTAIGGARAALPMDILRSYVVAQACKDAGLIPISEEARSALRAEGAAMLPFLGENQYQSAVEINMGADALVQPLVAFLRDALRPRFSYAELFGGFPTWEEIRDGKADNPHVRALTEREIERLTSAEQAHRLQEKVSELFGHYRETVKHYVEQNGPMAFVNLFEGNGVYNGAGARPVGIKERLARILDGRRPDTGERNIWPTVDDGERKLHDAFYQIQHERGDALGKMFLHMSGRDQDQATYWTHAYESWANARILEACRRMLLGNHGILHTHFLEPAMRLTEQLRAFGKVLETMSEIYTMHGRRFENFEDFRYCGDDQALNLGGMSAHVHTGLREWMQRNALAVDPMAVRSTIVQDFFQDPDRWLWVDENEIMRFPNGVELRHADAPVAARRAFDRCLRNLGIQTPAISLLELYHMARNSGISAPEFARMTVQALVSRSRPLVNHGFPGSCAVELVYPHEIHIQEPALAAALQNEAQLQFPHVRFRASYDAGTISLHQLSEPFALCQLAELPRWEQSYEQTLQMAGNGLHSMSPDFRVTCDPDGNPHYQQMTPWADYPGIVYRRNPTMPDPDTGELCRDGRGMRALEELAEEARKTGVLYLDTRYDKWVVRRVHLGWNVDWQFDPERLTCDPDTGLLPTGHELLRQIIAQNGVNLEELTRAVTWDTHRDLFTSLDEEKAAWHDALRALWFNRPMLAEVRDTLERIRPWYQMVEERNEAIR